MPAKQNVYSTVITLQSYTFVENF